MEAGLLSSAQQLTVFLSQFNTKQEDKKHNLKVMEDQCKRAAQENVDLIVFPELSLSGYFTKDSLYNIAEPIPEGESVRKIVKMAEEYNLHIIFGMPEQVVPGVLHNASVLVGPTKGVLGVHRKIYLPGHGMFDEKRYFRPGQEINVFPMENGVRIGMIVCYDLYSPEITRGMAFKGADVLTCISASPGTRQHFFETFLLARALENGYFVVYVNKAGMQDQMIFWGGSEVIDPTGTRLCKAKYDEPDTQLATLNLDLIRGARLQSPSLKDTKSWLFEELNQLSKRF